MRINIWIIIATLLALFAITRYVQEGRHTEHICANDPTASACERAFFILSQSGERPER
jgi:hypothetical protein